MRAESDWGEQLESDAFRIKRVGLKRWVKQRQLYMGIVTRAGSRANIAALVIVRRAGRIGVDRRAQLGSTSAVRVSGEAVKR
jgi:hypothetical protein